MTARQVFDVNGGVRFYDPFGEPAPAPRPHPDMTSPVACGWCGHVHDAGKVTVTARYLDCSVWRCPSCNVEQDDRPGNARSSARRLR